MHMFYGFFFFFKQKTAYEMRISDWSSDVCSSDLAPIVEGVLADAGVTLADVDAIAATAGPGLIGGVMVGLVTGKALAHAANKQIGRAEGSESVCQVV